MILSFSKSTDPCVSSVLCAQARTLTLLMLAILPASGAAPRVGISAANTYFNSLPAQSRAAVPSHSPGEIQALAAGLENDPALIVAYVRNNFRYVPYYGHLKGPHETLMDQSGNDYDLACLTVELLRAAGHTPSYVRGTVTYPLATVANWLEVSNTQVSQLLSEAGIPHDAPSSNIAIERIWVRVNGVDVDPAFKGMSITSPSINLGTAMGYNQSQLLTGAGGTVGTNWVSNVNATNVENRLQGYAATLRNQLENTHPYASMAQVLGGSEIVHMPVSKGDLASLAITGTSSASTFANPDAKRMHTVKISLGAEERIINMPEIDGRIFHVGSTPASAQPSGQTPFRFDNFSSIAAADSQVGEFGRMVFTPLIQGGRHQYFSFTVNKTRFNAQTGGSDQIEILNDGAGIFRLAGTDGSGSTLPLIPAGSTSLYYSTSAALTSYLKKVHVYVRSDAAPGSYEATLKVASTSLSVDFPSGQTTLYEIPLFATVLPNHVMQLKVGDSVIWDDSALTAADRLGNYEMDVMIDHPYPANGGTLADHTTLGDDRTRLVFRGSKYVFLTQGGDARWTGRRVADRIKRTNELLAAGASQQSDEVLINTLSAFGSQYLLEDELVAELTSRMTNAVSHNHHQFAVAKLEAGYVMDHIMWSPWAVGRSGMVNSQSLHAISSMLGSALEHGSSEQFQDGASISTIKALHIANAAGQRIYKVDKTNFSTITSELTGYTPDLLTYYQQRANDLDITYVLPQNGTNQLNDWKGHGYMEIWPGGGRGMLIGSGFNFWDPTYGGVSTIRYPYGIGWESYAGRLETLERERRRRLLTARMAAMSEEPVDLKTGAYVYNMTELTVGSAAPPRGLDFQRSYNSDASTVSGPLGRGWDHNWNSRLQATTDPLLSLGMRRPADAAAILTACHTLKQLLEANQNTAQGLVVQAVVAKWAVDQIKDSSVSVKVANETIVFAKHPDGAYTAPPGVKMTLEANGTSGHLLKNRFGTTFTFNTAGQLTGISDVYGKALVVTWQNDRVNTVKDAYNRQLTFGYNGSGLLTSLTDSTGRSMAFSYLNGNLGTFTDPDSNVFSYQYDVNHRLREFRNGENEIVAINQYDSRGKVAHQDSEGDANRRWLFHITPYRTVQEDPEGGQTIYEYDRLGRQISQTDALGNRQTFGYNAHNQLVAAVDAKQQLTEFDYDNRLNLTGTRKFKDSVAVETHAGYDALNRQNSVTNSNGHSVIYQYNAYHEKEWEETPDGDRTNYSYYPPAHAAAGQLHTITVPGENSSTLTTTYLYDSLGHVDHIDYPDNTSEDYTYNTRGDLVSLLDRNQNLWQYQYHQRRLLHREIDPNLAETTRTYNSYGKLLTLTDRNGNQTVNTWYPAGRLKDTTNAEEETTAYQYDRRDWAEKVISPLLNEIVTTYHANGWIDEFRDPLQLPTKHFYQPNGNREIVRNALGQDTVFGFDDLDRVETVTNTRNVEVANTLDEAGNTRFLRNGRNHEAESVFDKLNRETDFYTPLRRHTHRAYSPRGLLISVTEPSTQAASIAYNPVGRVDTYTDNLGLIDYSYDANGNLETVTEGSNVITREYDNLNRLELYRNAAGEEIEYRYHPEGQLWKIIYPDKTKVVEYLYDDANRLKTVKDWNNRTTTCHWDGEGRLEAIDRANGTRREITYDAAGRTTTIREIAAGGKIIAFYKFDRDALGRIKHEVRAPRSPAFHTASQNATFDADDRLTTLNGQNVSNDADGNMTHVPVSSTNWKNFQYDSRNRLTAVGTPQEWENIFDAEGHRVEYRNQGVPTKFVVSPGTLPKTLVQINDDGTRRYFVHGLGLLYHIDDEDIAAPVTTTYHYNAQGSTIALSDDSGSAVGRFHYDPYGLLQRKEGNTDTIFQFNGHYGIATDPTGLVHLNARFYNPYLKRFMNADPAGFAGGMNWFAYSAGDPVNLMDPLGLGPADSERYTWVDGVQDGIGTLGFIPAVGAIPDGVNGVIYLFRGKWGDAGFSMVAMVPLAGDFVAGARYADKLNDVRRIADGAGNSGKSLLPGEGAVGTYDDLIAAGTKGDNITAHHIPSANHMAQHSVSKGDGIAINMEQPFPGSGGRHRATFTYGTQADLNLTPREALGQGIWDARRVYQQDGLYSPNIRSSLQDLIRQNRAANPGLFDK